jgi:hypothetical protein
MIPAERHAFASNVRMSSGAGYSRMDEYTEGKWPVWLRLVTIIGLSAGLWAAIIWAAAAIFG